MSIPTPSRGCGCRSLRNQRRACVVVLADRDKLEMDAELAAARGGSRLRVVTRRGIVTRPEDLVLAPPFRATATDRDRIVDEPDEIAVR